MAGYITQGGLSSGGGVGGQSGLGGQGWHEEARRQQLGMENNMRELAQRAHDNAIMARNNASSVKAKKKVGTIHEELQQELDQYLAAP